MNLWRKMIILTLAAVLLICALPLTALAASPTLSVSSENVKINLAESKSATVEISYRNWPEGGYLNFIAAGPITYEFSGFDVVTINATGTGSATLDVVICRKSDNSVLVKKTVHVTVVNESVKSSNSGSRRNWSALMKLPSKEEIAAYNKTSNNRSPYISVWMDTSRVGKFCEIAVDFKADYLPSGTYCSLANFYMDYPSLNAKYQKVTLASNGISGYAGFQRLADSNRYISILSFWDLFCYDASGRQTTISPWLIYPKNEKETRFGNEGTGTHYLRDYPWEAEHWYRFIIHRWKNEATGNASVEYWVVDLETKAWTKLCEFDIGTTDFAFTGNVGVFLENFEPSSAGDIRTLEFCNFRVCNLEGNWVPIESAYFEENYHHPGSYQYGSDGKCFWIITSGIPNLAPKQDGVTLTVKNSESGSPF